MPTANNGKSASRRVMIIGFDGATLDLIGPWVKAGLLPTFARLMKEGAWGPMRSTMPPVTPAAWNTMATGMNQGKHGLFDFFMRQEGSYETMLVNTTHRHGATVWGLLSEAGYRVNVFNLPASYPPDQVNGTMVSGLLTPNQATDATWPRDLLAELKQAVPGFGFYPPGIFSKGQEAKFVQDVLNWDQMTLQGTQFVTSQQDWDFLFTVFIGSDIVSHVMWKYMTTEGASLHSDDPAAKEAVAHAIQRVYQQADEIIAKFLATAGDDTYVLVVSDHGFGPQENYLHLNAWLAQRGYLKFKRNLFTQFKYLMYRLGITPLRILETLRALGLGGQVKEAAGENRAKLDAMIKRAFLSFNDVDWSRTTAYAAGFGTPIFVNLKGREPQGCVEPGAEYEALLKRLTDDLRAMRHPATGEPFVDKILRSRDLFFGPYADRAPDLMFEPRDWKNQAYGLHDFASNRWLEPSSDHTGTHRMDGILFLHGPGVRPGYAIQNATLCDVAPTVLALMGVPIPTSMDGQPLAAALSDELKSQLKIAYRDADQVADMRTTMPVMSEEDEKIIRDRLEALGYLG